MKIQYKTILNNLSAPITIDEISKKLFQLGHEHDIKDEIFDIEITPNRGDCLSLLGILRELNLFYELTSDFPLYDGKIKELKLDFQNYYEDVCPYISFMKVEIEEINNDFDEYINEYFIDLNVNKKNFFTDISNYVAFELGQPLHCYDAKKLNGGIEFNSINDNFKFETLLDKEIILIDKNFIFKNNEKVINLAGVVGDKFTSCSDKTKEVIVECAYFKPDAIIGKSIKYDIQSEAAYKFERGVDPKCHNSVLRRFLKIVSDHATIKNVEFKAFNFDKYENRTVPFDLKAIQKIIGHNIDADDYKNYLSRLNFNLRDNIIEVPSYRHDISNQNDLAEEIARCIGYDNIKPIEHKIISSLNHEPQIEDAIRAFFVENGFNEVINFPFVPENNKNNIVIDNPIDSNKFNLRTSLKESLLRNLEYNLRRQHDSIKLFEISNIYTSEVNIEENKLIGIICAGRTSKDYLGFSKILDDKYLRAILCNILDNTEAINKIDQSVIDAKTSFPVYYYEFKVDDLKSNIMNYDLACISPKSFIQYEEISDFPSCSRDLSFSISDFDQIKNLEDKVLCFDNKFLKSKFIFDYFHNKKLNEVKIGFRFIFQSKERTLEDTEVELIMKDIIEIALKIKGVSIPGLSQ